jgi:hypothetical protein
VGSCNVISGAALAAETVDAGNSINITGGGGQRALQRYTSGSSLLYGGLLDRPGNFFNPGSFTVNGSGAAGIGAFSAAIAFPPALTWTNQNSISNVDRAQGVTVTWSGGAPDGFVFVQGFSTAAGNPAAGAQFLCVASATAGSFTVPPYVTLAMPPGNPSIPPAIWPASLWVFGFAMPVPLRAAGLDLGGLGAGNVSLSKISYGGSASGGGGNGKGNPADVLSISSISPSSFVLGQTTAVTVRGTGLGFATAIEFSPSAGLTVSGIQPSAASVTAQVTVAANAAAGNRQIVVVTPQRRSNALPISIVNGGEVEK